MHDRQSLSHVRWDCKYHVVIVPKYRKRNLYGKFKRHVGEIIKDLCRQWRIELLEGNLRADHVHMCLRIPPKFSVAFVIGFLKGKSAVRIHRYLIKNTQTKHKHFWSRGYCVSTVGLDEETIADTCYFGRGHIQLSWNANYGAFSELIYGDMLVLLDDPD